MSDALDLAIAQGAPRVDFSPLANLLQTYVGGQKLRQQSDAITAFRDGLPTGPDGSPDFSAMAKKYYEIGDPQTGTALSNLALQRGNLAFAQKLAPLIGGMDQNPSTAASAAPTSAPSSGPSASYMPRVAAAESGGNPSATNPASSATGTFQITDQTWAGLMRKYPQLGLTPDGRTDPAQQQKAMAALTGENANALSSGGFQVNDANLYLSHFLGAPGAAAFLKGLQTDPNAPAASYVGAAGVRSNPSLFFDQANGGKPISAQHFYQTLTSKVSPANGQGDASAGLLPSGADPQQRLATLRTIASLGILPQGAQKALEQQIEAIQKSQEPTNERKDYLANRNPGEGYEQYAARIEGAKERSKEDVQMGKTMLTEAGKNAQAAQTMNYRLDLIDKSINDLGAGGFLGMGTGANQRAALAKGINSMVDAFGLDPSRKIDPTKVATIEDFNKQTTNLGFDLARTLGAREAMMIVQQAVNSVPNVEQSPMGAKLVSASLRQAAQRQQDYQDFLVQKYKSGQSIVGADSEFNKLHPPSDYSQAALKASGFDQNPQQKQAATNPQPTQFTEGATATNPQTGQRVQFKGGQWVPLQ